MPSAGEPKGFGEGKRNGLAMGNTGQRSVYGSCEQPPVVVMFGPSRRCHDGALRSTP